MLLQSYADKLAGQSQERNTGENSSHVTHEELSNNVPRLVSPLCGVWRCVVCDVMLMAGGRGTVEEEVSWWQRRDTSAAVLVSNDFVFK